MLPSTLLGAWLWTRSFESEEIVQYHFSDINWAQGQNMSHLINRQCINGYLKGGGGGQAFFRVIISFGFGEVFGPRNHTGSEPRPARK